MSDGLVQSDGDDAGVEQLRSERDLYRSLLDLADHQTPEVFLRDALALVLRAVGARQGYLEIRADGSDSERWSIAEGFSASDVDAIRSETSRGIVAETLASGRTVHTTTTPDGAHDAQTESVQRNKIQEIVCAGIHGRGCHGVVYLQSGVGDDGFYAGGMEKADLFAKHVAPLASGLLARSTPAATDPTHAFRERFDLRSLVGSSPALAAVFQQVALLAPLDIQVMLTGQSGTGKSALAQALAANGPRRTKPFVHLNCAALPETLFESELFGAARGAHSTANRDLSGKLVAAEGGTLFLDEIGELSPSAQAKLLHLIQTRRYHPLGSANERVADVRIIAAANVPLEELVAAGRFRADLMYRMQVLPIRMPSLSERIEDIPTLLRYFCRQTAHRHEMRVTVPTEAACRAAQAEDWPGNVRQLANAAEAATIRANGLGDDKVGVHHLFPERAAEPDAPATYSEATRDFQRALVLRTLDKCDWNISEGARQLGIARSHVYNLLEALGVKRTS